MVANNFPKNTYAHKIFHLLSNVEIAFAFWALIYFFYSLVIDGKLLVFDFTEPVFVAIIMCLAATKSVIYFCENIIYKISRLLPFSSRMSFYLTVMIFGPLLGSLITEPAAMTMVASILFDVFFKESMSKRFQYATLALMFVSISLGGTLTNFAAPPVVMVASKWQWSNMFMFTHFGYKALLSIIVSTVAFAFYFRKEITGKLVIEKKEGAYLFLHLLFLVTVVLTSHQPKFFISIFILFFIFARITKTQLKIKESAIVGLFLAGLVILGSAQGWWIQSLIASMNHFTLFLGATVLTGIVDNAALTYLGSLIPMDDAFKYALMAGAVAGGGLTVIANAPNPIAYEILKDKFGTEGINPIKLFLWALFPTVIACFSLWLLP